MGNIILSNSFVDVANANITARSEATGYPKINVMDRWNLKRRSRADDKTANDYLHMYNFGGAQTLVGIALIDVNFNKVKFQGHASDSWGSPTYAGTDLTISQNKVTGRYNIYAALTGFNYQYLRIFIPTGTTAVGTYTTKWEIGAVCFLSAVTTLSHNMSYGYAQTGQQFFQTSVNERIKTGETTRWEGAIVFGDRSTTYESELWTLSRMDMSLPFIYYENRSDTSAVYLCVRDDAFTIRHTTHNGVSGNTIKIKEAYRIDE